MLLATCLLAGTAAAAEPWHHPLTAGDGDYWRRRIQIRVHNPTGNDLLGTPLGVAIGSAAGQADLAGYPAESIRVCDASGTELLFHLAGPTGLVLVDGTVPASGTLYVPVTVAAGGTSIVFAYFDNPSAWELPDVLRIPDLPNPGFEHGDGDVPDAWAFAATDEEHRLALVGEGCHGGSGCLRAEGAPGADDAWLGAYLDDIHVFAGLGYRLRGWVRLEGVSEDGGAGWALRMGSSEAILVDRVVALSGGESGGWHELTMDLGAPEAADRAMVGTVLRGTGSAWFDDISLELTDDAPSTGLQVDVSAPEVLLLDEAGADPSWYVPAGDDTVWDHRLPVAVVNVSDLAVSGNLASFDLNRLGARDRHLDPDSIRVTDGTEVVHHWLAGDLLLFEAAAAPQTRHSYHLYLSLEPEVTPRPGSDYGDLVASSHNLVANPGFEVVSQGLPQQWNTLDTAGAVLGTVEPGRFGERCAMIEVSQETEPGWTGWAQLLQATGGTRYLFSCWLRTEDSQGQVWLWADGLDRQGRGIGSAQIGPPLHGTTEWSLRSGLLPTSEEVTQIDLNLTTNQRGRVFHDGVAVVPVTGLAVQEMVSRQPAEISVWQVPALVKVFPDHHPPRDVTPPRISAARGESEPLQLAVRSATAIEALRVEAEPPESAAGDRLDPPSVAITRLVPVDHVSGYHQITGPSWQRPVVTGAGADGPLPSNFGEVSDGWAGWWPDPLVPATTVDLEAATTRALWLTFEIPAGTPAGDYRAAVRLSSGETLLQETRLTVHVWDFGLGQTSRFTGIFGIGTGPQWKDPGETEEEARQRLWRLAAAHRLAADAVWPEPVFEVHDGAVRADFAAFDAAAAVLVDEFGARYLYMPWTFSLFGWGTPPGIRFGEAPYPGTYPYDEADRSQLRPEYTAAYQAVLGAFWDHLGAMGWQDRFVLFIADEPFYWEQDIIDQMLALCAMVHEVDPAIPVYSSTWVHVPEWDGAIDVWGIAHAGETTLEDARRIRAAGGRLWFTTDGQICLDTPFTAVERLLPWYGFSLGAEAFEFWAFNWLTQDPWRFGWHAPTCDEPTPGQITCSRFPNGDGFLVYPGSLIGMDGARASIRLEQLREGMEDHAYLSLLAELTATAAGRGCGVTRATAAMAQALDLVEVPAASGLRSTEVLPDPEALYAAREALAEAIEGLRADPCMGQAPSPRQGSGPRVQPAGKAPGRHPRPTAVVDSRDAGTHGGAGARRGDFGCGTGPRHSR